MAIRRNSRSSPRARQRTYKQSTSPFLQKLSQQTGKPQPAKWIGLESLEMRQLLSTAIPSQFAVSNQVVISTRAAQLQQEDQGQKLQPVVATPTTPTYVVDEDGNTTYHPGSCGCPVCMGFSAPGDEALFQEALTFSSGGGATVAGGTVTGISPTVTLGNKTPNGQVPYGADYRANSEYMAGDVWVTIVLLNSNGQVDAKTEPNWSSSQIAQVKTEVIEGLNWWEETFRRQNPGTLSELNFFVDFTYTDNPVATKYEPINRNYSQYGLWVDDFLDAAGANTASSTITDVQKFNDAQRRANNTDWAFTVFIANSLNDTDGKFADNYFAYSYFGGPFLTMTYDNGGWGIDRMGQVMAHETGHIFYALDEYSGGNSYTTKSGYYGTQNLNALTGNPNPASRLPSIMAEAALQDQAYPNFTSAPSTLQMLGWRDSNSNGVFDVLDVPLTLTGSGSYSSSTGQFSFSGNSTVGTLANQNSYGPKLAVTTNTVDFLQYRLNGGGWVNANATAYRKYSTAVSASVQGVPGNNTIEFRTIDSTTGVASNIISSTFTVAGATAGVTVSPTQGLITTESGGTASFTVRLNSQPTGNVTVPVSSSNSSEGTASASTLTFTPANWNTPQTVTVTGVEDLVVDGDRGYSIVLGVITSVDGSYSGMNPADVSVTNTDNDVAVPAGIRVSPTQGLVTSESGSEASFTVLLESQPTSDVVISVLSSKPGEGTPSVSSLTFTPANWNVAQTVTVSGADEGIADGDQNYKIILSPAISMDSRYHQVDPEDVTLVNEDNDPVGVFVAPTADLITTEAGGTASFVVYLIAQPTADVVIDLSSSNTAEGVADTGRLIFTTQNWNIPQTVTVTGVTDDLVDGNTPYLIQFSSVISEDARYNGMQVGDVSLTNADLTAPQVDQPAASDQPAFIVNVISSETTEAGGTATFTVRLSSAPTAPVTINLDSSDRSAARPSSTSLKFTANNWNAEQTITVTGRDNFVASGDTSFQIVFQAAKSKDAGYNGLIMDSIQMVNKDDDTTAVIVVTDEAPITTNKGGRTKYTIALASEPTSDVVIDLASSDTSIGKTNKNQVVLKKSNWKKGVNVVVTGVKNKELAHDVAYGILHTKAVSDDIAYSGAEVADLLVTNIDAYAAKRIAAALGGKASEATPFVPLTNSAVLDRISNSSQISTVDITQNGKTGLAVVDWLNSINKPVRMTYENAA